MSGKDRDDALLALQQAKFTAIDLALFLDTHPDCAAANDAYRSAVFACEEAEAAFTDRFGPVCQRDAGGDRWDWTDTPWPWQEREA